MTAPGKAVSGLLTGVRSVSKRLVFSYVLDWVLIIGIVAIGGAFSLIDGSRHAFSLNDLNISYPYNPDTVTMEILLIVTIVVPGIITAAISLLVVPGPTVQKSTPKSLIWRRKLWEWNTAWMGLGLALGSAFMITEGLKDIAGKPRPHLLAVCNPDTNPSTIQKFLVSGLGDFLDSEFPIMVDWRICQTKDNKALRNAFSSFPSGHSSFSWAGLLYLTFFICAKFAVQLPFLPYTSASHIDVSTFGEYDQPRPNNDAEASSSIPTERVLPPRNAAAAPPIYLLIIAFIPIGGAFYISTSRWFDYRHDGFDIICGSLIGIFTAWFGFRWYHLPIRRGAGWAWGARSRDRAFWVGLGTSTYVGQEGWDSASKKISSRDIESGTLATSGGLTDEPQSKTAARVPNTYSENIDEEAENR